MAAIRIVLFVLTSCCLALWVIPAAEADQSETPVLEMILDINKQSNVLAALKSDLRRNNDDYVESTPGTLNISNPYLLVTGEATTSSGGSATTQQPQGTYYYTREQVQSNGRRKFMPQDYEKNSLSEETNDTKVYDAPMQMPPLVPDLPATLNSTTAHRVQPSVEPSTAAATLKRAVPRGGDRHRGKETTTWKNRKDRVENFKSFVKKNKQMFSDLMRSQQAQRGGPLGARLLAAETPRGAGRAAPGARGAGEPPEGQGGASDSLDQAPLLPPHKSEALRFRAARAPPLSPDQMDMSPAKGAQIHRLRLKSKLCQRSVLIPEGPKYNSKGQVYLQAYGHYHGRDYRHTRLPPLLLPRCCNCCKKSVLGCE